MHMTIHEALRLANAIGESEIYVLATKGGLVELRADPDNYIVSTNHSGSPYYTSSFRSPNTVEVTTVLMKFGVTDRTEWFINDI